MLIHAVIVAGLLGPAQQKLGKEYGVEARATYWEPAIWGEFVVDDDHTTAVDFDEDLDLKRRHGSGLYELYLTWHDRHKHQTTGVGLYYWDFAASGSEILDSPEVVDESTFPAGNRVRSRFRLLHAGFDTFIRRNPEPEQPFSWSFGGGLFHTRAKVEMKGSSARESEEFADINFRLRVAGEWHPLPEVFVGGSAALHLDPFSLIMVALGGNNSDYLHGGVDVSLYVGAEWGPARLEAGVRGFVWSQVNGNEEIDVILHGPYASVILRF